MNIPAARILLVDDEPNVLKSLCRLLRDYDLTTANSGEEALLQAQNKLFDLVISDYRMPGIDGVRFLTKFKLLQPDSIRMVLTGYADLESVQHAINDAEVFRFINKPWNNIEVINAVEKGLEHKRILIENRNLAEQVREQQALLNEQNAILTALEKEEPGITKVKWRADGAIILDDSDYD